MLILNTCRQECFVCLFRVNWADVNGTLYKKSCIVVLKMEEYPIFGKVLNIFECNSSVIFEVQVFDTLAFNEHFHCFIVEASSSHLCVNHSALFSFLPHQLRIIPEQSPLFCLVPRHHFTCNV